MMHLPSSSLLTLQFTLQLPFCAGQVRATANQNQKWFGLNSETEKRKGRSTRNPGTRTQQREASIFQTRTRPQLQKQCVVLFFFIVRCWWLMYGQTTYNLFDINDAFSPVCNNNFACRLCPQYLYLREKLSKVNRYVSAKAFLLRILSHVLAKLSGCFPENCQQCTFFTD